MGYFRILKLLSLTLLAIFLRFLAFCSSETVSSRNNCCPGFQDISLRLFLFLLGGAIEKEGRKEGRRGRKEEGEC